MTIGPDLEYWRSFVVSTLPDSCTITLPSTAGTLDTIDGDWTPAAPTTLYSGLCRVRTPSLSETNEMFGGATRTRQTFVVVIPYDAGDIPEGARVEVTDSTDMQLVDQHLAVVSVRMRSNLVDRRLGCEAL